MIVKSGNNTFEIPRKPAGESSTLHSSGKGIQIKTPEGKPPACATHDYSNVIGWNHRG